MSTWLRFFFGAVVWLFILIAALWRGERPERTVAGAHLIGMLVTPVVQKRVISNAPDLGVMAVDVAVLIVLVWVALRANRWWTMFSAAFFLITVGIHIIKATRPDTGQHVYATSQVFFNYLSLYALGAGMIALERRRWRARRVLYAG